MGYPDRLDTPGSLHHVTNRGLGQRPMFERGEHVRFFLSRLALQSQPVFDLGGRLRRPARIEVQAFSCLTNHYHLLVESLTGELSEAMRQSQSHYVRWFNQRSDRDGTLLRGRFKSQLVDSDLYLQTLVRYIDFNAVEAKIVDRPEAHAWGSASAYLGGRKPPWLDKGLLSRVARRETEHLQGLGPVERYRAAFGQRVTADETSWIEQRLLRASRGGGKLDDLIALSPAGVRAWLVERTRNADGGVLDAPFATWSAVQGVIRAELSERGGWELTINGRSRDPFDLMEVGLLRALAGLSWSEIRQLRGGSASGLHLKFTTHQKQLMEGGRYAECCSRVALASVKRSTGIRREILDDRPKRPRRVEIEARGGGSVAAISPDRFDV